MSLYKKHREQVKKDIVQLSLSLFREHGYELVTIEQITTQLEIAKGTFYNYFKSKRDILMFWAEEQFASIDIHPALDEGKNCEENLYTLLTIFTGAITGEYNLYKIFLKELEDVPASQNNNLEAFDFTKLLSLVISKSKDGNRILNNNAELKLRVLNSAIFYELKTWLLLDKELSELTKHLIRVMMICLYGILEQED